MKSVRWRALVAGVDSRSIRIVRVRYPNWSQQHVTAAEGQSCGQNLRLAGSISGNPCSFAKAESVCKWTYRKRMSNGTPAWPTYVHGSVGSMWQLQAGIPRLQLSVQGIAADQHIGLWITCKVVCRVVQPHLKTAGVGCAHLQTATDKGDRLASHAYR